MQIIARKFSLLLAALLMIGCADHSRPSSAQDLSTGGAPIANSDADFMSRQIIPCWNFDAGIEHPENYTVSVRIQIQPDGSIAHAEIDDPSRLQDPVYREVAQRAIDAVENPSCQPLHFPSGKYWPEMVLVFDLEKAINGGY